MGSTPTTSNQHPQGIDFGSEQNGSVAVQSAIGNINGFFGRIGLDRERLSGIDIFNFILKSDTTRDYEFYWSVLVDFVGDLHGIDPLQFKDAIRKLKSQYPSYIKLSELLADKEKFDLDALMGLPDFIKKFLQNTYHVLRFQTYCGHRHGAFETSLKNKNGIFIKTPTKKYYLKFDKSKTIVNPNTCYMAGFSDWYMNIFFRVFRNHTGKDKHLCIQLDTEIPSLAVADDNGEAAEVNQGICQKILSVPESEMEIVRIPV